ncbi:MAG: glycoside hydrolase family 13 protein [Desulfurococcaceae archaeon]
MLHDLSVMGLVFLVLMLINLSMCVLTFAYIEQISYINETNLFIHIPSDTAYLSIADEYVIVRLMVHRSVNAKEVYLVVNNEEVLMKPQLYLMDYVVWFTNIPYTSSELYYYFKIMLSDGSIIMLYNNRSKPAFFFDGANKYPQVNWVKSRVGYQIFPDRFYNGDPSNDHYALLYDSLLYDNTTTGTPVLSEWSDQPHIPYHCCHQYYGGDIKGIILKLDYLKELGVGLIYLNPIFLCGSTHCYDTYDYYQLNPRLGTLEELKELLTEAHRRNIKVIFDFVPGHVGLGFWAFQDVVLNGPNSSYWKWFTVYKWPFTPGDGRAYRCWYGFGSLPQLNTTIPEVRDYLIKAVLYWLETGFDGVRIDTPLDLINPREFFTELREAIKSRFPEAYIVGEIWQLRPEWVNHGPFDSLMNYALGLDILVEYAKGGYSDNIAYVLSNYYAKYSVAAVGMGFNIIGSHDTDRVLTMLGGGRLFPEPNPPRESIDRLKLLSTLQYTQPGMPVIFQGDERGIPGIKLYPWEEHRYPIQWDRLNTEIYEHYRQLGWIKNNLKPLHTSIIRVFETTDGVLAYTRGYNDELLIVANNKPEQKTIQLPGELSSIKWIPLYSSSGIQPEILNNTLIIPPLTAVLLLNNEYADNVFVNTTTPVVTRTNTPTETTRDQYISTNTTSPSSTELPALTHHITSNTDWRTLLLLISFATALTIIALMLSMQLKKHR